MLWFIIYENLSNLKVASWKNKTQTEGNSAHTLTHTYNRHPSLIILMLAVHAQLKIFHTDRRETPIFIYTDNCNIHIAVEIGKYLDNELSKVGHGYSYSSYSSQ